jgi:glutaredoxin-like protein NrdH
LECDADREAVLRSTERGELGRERTMPDVRGAVSGSAGDHSVMFYGLSTCGWCKRTREFLEENSVAFDYMYVDLLEGGERAQAIEEIRRVNPKTSFPTVVIDGDAVVVGYDPDRLKEALDL